jgi:hypothetical protein
MKQILTAYFAQIISAEHGLNLEVGATSSSLLAFGWRMKFYQAHAVEKSDMCQHLESLAEKLPTYGRRTL